MSSVEVFSYFWLGLVGLGALFFLVKAVHDLRKGQGRWSFMGEMVNRTDDPFHYWFMVVQTFIGFIVTCFMFWFGLDMLRW